MDTRRKFSREFKLEAVKMVKDRGVALRQVARDLDLNENMLRRWIRESSMGSNFCIFRVRAQSEDTDGSNLSKHFDMNLA